MVQITLMLEQSFRLNSLPTFQNSLVKAEKESYNLKPSFFPLKHFVWQFPEGHHQMPGSVHQCVSREKKLSACWAQGTFSPPKLIFIHKSTLRNGLSSHCVHSRGLVMQYFCTVEDGRWKIGVCVQRHASASVLCTLCPLMLSCRNPERHESIKALPSRPNR